MFSNNRILISRIFALYFLANIFVQQAGSGEITAIGRLYYFFFSFSLTRLDLGWYCDRREALVWSVYQWPKELSVSNPWPLPI